MSNHNYLVDEIKKKIEIRIINHKIEIQDSFFSPAKEKAQSKINEDEAILDLIEKLELDQ